MPPHTGPRNYERKTMNEIAPNQLNLQSDLFEHKGSAVNGVPADPPIQRMVWRYIYQQRAASPYADTRRAIPITLPKIKGIFRGKPNEIS